MKYAMMMTVALPGRLTRTSTTKTLQRRASRYIGVVASSSRTNQCQCEQRPFSSNTGSKNSSSIPWYGAPRPPQHNTSATNATASATAGSATSPLFSTGLSPLERVGVALHSATTALADPTRADAVAALGEVTGHVALQNMYGRMMSDPTGQRILKERPLVDGSSIDLDVLLSTGSSAYRHTAFGYQYASFMKGHGFDPDERAEIRFIADPGLAYIMLRYHQCHDFWHTLTGLPPTVLGELALKWLEVIQTGLPVAALSATVGSFRLSPAERRILNEVYLPWAVRVGRNAEYLMNVYYEDEFDTDIDELRKRLRIETVPSVDTI